MAAPNILTANICTAKTTTLNIGTTLSTLITNASSSNQVYKLNTVIVSNGISTAITANVLFNRSTGTTFLAGNVTVPGNSSLVVLGKDTALYLEENDTIQVSCNTASTASFTCSYEVIS
jgi:hypothetical protein